MRLSPGIVALVLLSLFGGCTTPTPNPPPSAWHGPLTIGSAEQTAAPAIYATNQQVTLAWVGSSPSGVHQDAVALRDGQITPSVTLPLPPTAPRDSQLIPAAGERNHHLLWLDLDDTNTPQLYTAVIDRTLGVFRGSIAVSERGARCYALFSNADGSAWAVWQDIAQPSALHSAYIDSSGRVLRTRRLTTATGCPSTTDTGDTRYILWEQNQRVYLTQFNSGDIQPVQTVADAPSRASGDRLHGLHAANAGQQLYAIWNITRANGQQESWLAAGTPSNDWSPPQRITFITDTTPFETTYNTGPATTARAGIGGQQAAWANPLPGTGPILPIAAQVDGNTLGIVYVGDAGIVGYQPITPTNGLLGVPRLRADRDRFLYLTWSEPLDIGTAELRLITTNRTPKS